MRCQALDLITSHINKTKAKYLLAFHDRLLSAAVLICLFICSTNFSTSINSGIQMGILAGAFSKVHFSALLFFGIAIHVDLCLFQRVYNKFLIASRDLYFADTVTQRLPGGLLVLF